MAKGFVIVAALAALLVQPGFAQAQIEARTADRCDFLDPAVCLYPWPNDHFTRSDPSSPTGRRLSLETESMPRGVLAGPINANFWNLNDGFSPGNTILTKVPGLDSPEAFRRTGAVPITDIARYLDPDQPIVVINARTGERHPIWSEIDSNPPQPRDVTLIVRPAVNFEEGERYIVALRNLKDGQGRTIPTGEAFRAYRDRLPTADVADGDAPAVERRRAHFEEIFETLRRAGVARQELYLAWDFTVASERGLAGRALHIRDDAFRQLGDSNLADLKVEGRAPTFVQNPDLPDDMTGLLPDDLVVLDPQTLDGRRDFAPCSAGQDAARCEEGESDRIARIVTGWVVVPCYLNLPGCVPGSRFDLDRRGLPRRVPGNVALANAVCTIPRRALDGPDPPRARPSLYGHGLLGSAGEVLGGNVQDMAQEHGFVFCATDWAGMSTLDLPNVALILQNLSHFHTLADRAQQGFLNFLYLGRWMIHPDGLSAHTAFRVNGRSVVDAQRLFFDGNSQGGIMGGALTALAPDFEHAVLGVPAMNYSTLLRRSVDFDDYAHGEIAGLPDLPIGLYDNYPSELDRPLTLSLMQLLWDRGEANGYAHHMTGDPLPNTPPHEVLMHVALGDHQVADAAAEVEARTIGASVYWPALDPGRSASASPFFGIPRIGGFPFDGSAMVVWDSGPLRSEDGREVGTPPAPITNSPPRAGQDPHGTPRSMPSARRQKSEFLRIGGGVIDVCGGRPCYAGSWTGPG